LISKYGLFPRDLRKIEKTRTATTEIIPSISVRKSSILLNLLHLKALVLADEVVLFDDLGPRFSYTQSEFLKDLEKRLNTHNVASTIGSGDIPSLDNGEFNLDDLPYELKALEAVLESVITNLTAEMKVHTVVTQGILNELEEAITRDKLRFLLIQNKKISTFSQKATLIRDVIDELLDNDDDLAECYLTDKLHGRPRATDDHAEVEMLLESYYKHCDEIVQTINHLISNVRTTEEIINIILDSNRNQLMLLGLRFSIGLLTMGGAIFIASAYGMNLENFIEETDYGFPLVVVMTIVPVVVISLYSLKHLNKLQKITMMGDHYKKKR
jgi:magnesium transporter